MKTQSIWNMKIKKVYSDHPRLTEPITLREALKRYHEYVLACITSPFFEKDKTIKTFQQWRTTEI